MQFDEIAAKLRELQVPETSISRLREAAVQVPASFMALHSLGGYQEQDAAILACQVIREAAAEVDATLPAPDYVHAFGLSKKAPLIDGLPISSDEGETYEGIG